MISATIFDTKTKLSQLIKLAQQGNTITITSGKNKLPVARLEAIQTKPKQRLGLREIPGLQISESFWDSPPDQESYLWDGGGV